MPVEGLSHPFRSYKPVFTHPLAFQHPLSGDFQLFNTACVEIPALSNTITSMVFHYSNGDTFKGQRVYKFDGLNEPLFGRVFGSFFPVLPSHALLITEATAICIR